MVESPAVGRRTNRAGPVSRRTLLAAGAGTAGVLAGGCAVHNPVTDERTPASPAKPAPDVAVATRALSEIRAVRAAVSNTLTRFPAARPGLAALVEMHQVHEKSLADAVPEGADSSASGATAAPYVVPRRRGPALRNLANRERRLHDALDGLALSAQSGDFARLLACMGAAVSQRLAAWPR